MERYATKDNKVIKFVHDNGAETAIKFNSCETLNKPSKTILNKFSIFISSDSGCPIGCEFCYLSAKKFPYYKLSTNEVVDNAIEAIDSIAETHPQIKDMYIKLSYMGMSDPFLNMAKTYKSAQAILNYCNNLCAGIDGVDLGTTLPASCDLPAAKGFLKQMNNMLLEKTFNPLRNCRNPLRVFYSLHCTNNEIRQKMIPVSKHVEDAIGFFTLLPRDVATPIFHTIFLKDINDNENDILTMFFTANYLDIELRLLKFNKCPNSLFEEADYNKIYEEAINRVNRLKIQESSGSEVSAACGQFLLKKLI